MEAEKFRRNVNEMNVIKEEQVSTILSVNKYFREKNVDLMMLTVTT